MENLSEEEIIERINKIAFYPIVTDKKVIISRKDIEAIQGLLDLYNKEKEKNKELLENATVTYFNDEELKESVGNYLGVLLKKNIEKDYISKNKIREIIYPTPTNPISYEIQTSDMYKKLLELLEKE